MEYTKLKKYLQRFGPPARYDAEALTDVELWSIHYDDLQKIYTDTKLAAKMSPKMAFTSSAWVMTAICPAFFMV